MLFDCFPKVYCKIQIPCIKCLVMKLFLVNILCAYIVLTYHIT